MKIKFYRWMNLFIILFFFLPVSVSASHESVGTDEFYEIFLPSIHRDQPMVFVPAGVFPMGCDPAHDQYGCPPNELLL